jgi:serine/threonine protein kinase
MIEAEDAGAGEHSERELIETAWQEARGIAAVTRTGLSSEEDFPQPPPDSFSGYELVGELHRGGQAVVYLATQKATRRRVAIKVMREGPFAGPRDRARFEREVLILGQLNPSEYSHHTRKR